MEVSESQLLEENPNLPARHAVTSQLTGLCGCAESFAREVRALAVTVYFGSAALLWAVDSPHLAAVMVHLNVLESVLALKIKALNDSVSKAVQQLQSVQLQFALLVRL